MQTYVCAADVQVGGKNKLVGFLHSILLVKSVSLYVHTFLYIFLLTKTELWITCSVLLSHVRYLFCMPYSTFKCYFHLVNDVTLLELHTFWYADMKGSETITAFWNSLSWNGPLEVIWSNVLLKAGVISKLDQVTEAFFCWVLKITRNGDLTNFQATCTSV